MNRMRLVLVALLGLVLLLIPLLLWASAPPSEAYASLSTAIETVAPAQAVPELAANPADQHLTEQKGAPPIRLKSRTFTPAPGVGRALKGQLERLQAKAVDRAHVFLQFNKIPDKAERQALAARGVELLTYIPDRAWLASVPVTLNLDDLIASSPARWAGAILPGDKLETDLREGTIHKWAQDVDERVILVAQFFPDVDLEVGADLVTAYRGKVLHRVESINSLVVSLPQDAVNELAAEDIVEWIEQVEPALSPVNDGVRANIGADALQAAPYNLDGTGVRVLVFDGGGVDTTHPDFGGRVSLQSDAPGVSDHATHVAGTVGGDGSRSVAAGGTAQQWRGMAPNVRMFSDDYDAGAGPYIFYNNPGSIEVDYNEGVVTNTVDMVNTSLGMNLCGNYVDPDQVLPLDNPALVGLYGDYTSSAQLLDNIATGNWTGNVRLPLFWSAGNERNDTCFNHFDPQGHQTIDPPHAAKNPVIVGAINSNDSSMTTFSGYGPVDDGRLKPDVVGPGCQTSVDFAVTSTFTDTFYTQMCGTSMSTPAVTGVAALLLQQWRQTCAASDPLPSTYKALLVNTAQDLGNPGPDYAFGWGRVQAQLAADAIINQEVVEGSITHGGVYTYYVAMQSGGPQLRVTLAWDDPAAAPLSAVQLINNLDLFVIGPGTTMHRAWLLDPINPGNNATTGIDNLNNVEQVVVPTPVDGTYTVIVSGTNVPSGPQPFSLSIQPIELFVNSTADTSDGNPGDGICDTGTFATPTGICTLRAAIEEANATCGSDTIKFNIPAATDPGCNAGTGVCTIQPLSALPVIIDTVFIDGYSQPGASVASSNAVLKIVLDGSNAGDGVNGLVLETDESTIRGLNIHSFRVTKIDHPNQDFDFTHGNGIVIREGMTNTITGNFIGTNVDGDACVGNGGSGVLIGGYDSTADANRNTVGGTDPADRNVITCNGFQRDTSTPDPDDGTATGADGVTIRANRADSTIYSADGNQVLGNYISTDVTGMTTLAAGTQTFTYDSQTFDITYMGNTGNGVRIAGGSSNTVGGTTPGARNIISGNEAAGVRVEAVVFDDEDPPHTRAASNNVVQGNYIGTDVNGAADLGNLDVGVYIVGFVDDADGNQIGGTTGTTPGGPCTGACNLISGNGGGGVMILGSQASGNEIKGNYIGTDVNGAAAIPNTAGGIAIADAEDNTIGGATPEERNLISGNGGYGISIVNNAKAWSPDLEVFMGAGEASGNTIQGNYIGAEVTGAAALSNTLSGVLITDAADNVVSENLISGNGQNGVLIMTTGGAPGNVETNVVTAEGSANGDSVKGSDSAAVTVGGTSWLEVTKTADPTHLAPPGGTVTFTIGITNSGVLDVAIKRLSDSSHGNLNGQGSCLVPQTLGPGLSYTCVFSATVSDATGDSATDTVTASGTDANGTFVINSDSATVNITDLPPSILVTKTANPTTLTPPGGTVNFTVTVKNISVSETATITKTWDSKHGDLIPGVCAASVTLGPGDTFTCNYQGTVSGATGNTVEGNFIGTNVTGNAAVPNQGAGVVITSAPDNAIGGATAAQGNVISGNAREGVAILGTDATGNSLRHNVIGGTSALGNGSHGVSLAGAPSDNAIGKGSVGNTIAYNGGDGVVAFSGTGNQILSNSIFTNTELGIDLGGDGVTANDDDDPDAGANNLQNFPVLTSASSPVNPVIQGVLNSTPSTQFTIQFFSSPASLGCEGPTYLETDTTTTDGSGNATINTAITGDLTGQFVTATATDPYSNTSEFSNCIPVPSAPALAINKRVQDLNGGSAKAGDTLRYTIHYTNTGNAPATGVFITDIYSTFCVTRTNVTNGDFPDHDDNGTRLRWPATGGIVVDAQTSGSVRYDCTLQDPFPFGTTDVINTSTIDSDQTTPQQDTETVQVTAAPVLTIDKECTPAAGNIPGDTVHCTITYQNTGDAAAQNVTIEDDPDENYIASVSGITGGGAYVLGKITWNIGTVNPGPSASVSYDAELKGADAFPYGTTQVTNTVTIDCNETGPVQDTETIQVLDTTAPALTINKQAQDLNGGLAEPNDILRYTINYANTGNAQATGVFITDDYSDLCATRTNVTNGDFPNHDDNGDRIRWPATGGITLAALASGSVSFDCTLQATFPAGTTRVTNTCTIDSDETGPQQDTATLSTITCYDFNGNGVVDVVDVMEVAIRWGLTPGDPNWNDKYDVNGDGAITVVDIMMVAAQWGQTCP